MNLPEPAQRLADKLGDAGPMPAEAEEWVRSLLEEAWDDGYAASERDEARARTGPHTGGCDCLVPTPNPYEEDS